ncbi:toxin-antitoxin system YwqK family antitoxin [Croceitalea rosinachiae]|uniref:Nicotinic acid mononucleotide adenyltransferase n=1 Tax=Croceitalea rosinachiae TaxID=3075596 RepID=A0ABU3A830_9FLAO|nr:nicotinic acid mononucleotide adenyltransferase [Croceitalea sp. F388]MDT0606341.1 nicotinic acid mononucleotide adenyltransferase [Croceitalea sp. F388]
MKSLVISVIFTVGSFTMNAQKIEPKYEKVGEIVKAIYFHDNGQIAQIGCIKNGKLQGEWVMFTESGKKIAIGHYDEGKRIGEWFFWKVDGEALREVTYSEGRLVNVIEWNNSKDITL